MTFNEDHISQIPALLFLQKLGYTYLTPDEALSGRDNKLTNVLQEKILLESLKRINRFTYKGREHEFSDGALISVVQTIKNYRDDGLIRTNEQIYDLLCLGKSVEQTIDGDTKSFTVNYIDWVHPKNNSYHVTEEYAVERSGSYETYRPDIVLFVNGIPLVVIECKKPEEKDSLKQAISQHIRNQKNDGITRLFVYSQILVAINKNEAKYATAGTPEKFWAVWKEDDTDTAIESVLKHETDTASHDKIFESRYRYVAKEFQSQEYAGVRKITEQDRTLYSLARPERLLEFTYKYIVYDGPDKKIARYQQYNAIKKTLDRVKNTDKDGKRTGGVIWHTQGSGKSLTMVMLAKALALEPAIKNPKVIVVTDRDDLDKQISETFVKCGKEAERATTGRNLADLITENKKTIITTLVHKFQAILKTGKVKDTSPNIFVLVDEGHRTQYGSFHVAMNRVFPNACYIGFTGTPLMKKEKNTASKFGGIIDVYNIAQAVKDQAVVPLLYEGRYVELEVHQKSIDDWFERMCKDLSKDQQADLKRKFAKADQLNKSDKKIQRIAYDISEHFNREYKGTGFKGQLAADSKTSAVRFKKYLDEFGIVTSDVIISAPDQREGYSDIDEETSDEVLQFWKKMMSKYRTEEEYNKQIIDKFKSPDDPDIIIVVDKLLTGFDAPRNTVLYIARSLREHTLLQAIARVNRLCEGKDFGTIIDYYGVLGELDTAMHVYGSLEDFDADEVAGALAHVEEEIRTLPQKHSDLLDVFKTVKGRDEEAYEELLSNDDIRDLFYSRLVDFSKTLKIALSTYKFVDETPETTVNRYKRDLEYFLKLRAAVSRRYSETIKYSEYEGKIRKLIDQHVDANDITNITELVSIFDKEKFGKELEKIEGTAARADTIATRTRKAITEKWEDDPAFFKKFSKLLEDVIEEYRNKRITEAEYLKKASEICDAVTNHKDTDIPPELKGNPSARAYYGLIVEKLSDLFPDEGSCRAESARAGIDIHEIIEVLKIVDWGNNIDVQKRMAQRIDDYLFDFADKRGIKLDIEKLDELIASLIQTAKNRDGK